MKQLVTKEGYNKLLEEKKKVEQDLNKAVARLHDTSGGGGGWHENNFFEQLEQEIENIKRKLRDVASRIENAKILEDTKKSTDKVEFGSTVELEIESDKFTFTLLGESDADVSKGIISYLSPVGQALINKKEGEEVELILPSGKAKLKIIKVS